MPKTLEMNILLAVLLFSVGAASCAWNGTRSFSSVLPAALGEWTAEGRDERYHRDTLFEHIDGGAELYLTYGFVEALVRRYTDRGDSEIVLEIYDMGRSTEAFGIFTIEREDEDIGIGQDSEFGGGLLRFWRDRYFVSILATGDVVKAEPTMVVLAKAVDRHLGSRGPRPDLVGRLPHDGLDGGSIRFFHTADILNRRYYLSDENLLLLSRQTDCLLAEYDLGGTSARLLLIRYPDREAARRAHDTFLENYLPDAAETGVAQLENGNWSMVRRQEDLLVLVLESSTEAVGVTLLDGVTR